MFIQHSACAATVLSGAGTAASLFADDERTAATMRFGLVTYMWAADWDLPTLIRNCIETDVLGVELRTTHRHGVEPNLDGRQRAEVRQRFDNSPVTLVGLGSNERFDNPDRNVVRAAIERSKEFIVLSHDVGATGVKVKPDTFHNAVPREQTIEQIGSSLNELGAFATDYGQEVRLEVHGGCAHLPDIKAIVAGSGRKNVSEYPLPLLLKGILKTGSLNSLILTPQRMTPTVSPCGASMLPSWAKRNWNLSSALKSKSSNSSE